MHMNGMKLFERSPLLVAFGIFIWQNLFLIYSEDVTLKMKPVKPQFV